MKKEIRKITAMKLTKEELLKLRGGEDTIISLETTAEFNKKGALGQAK